MGTQEDILEQNRYGTRKQEEKAMNKQREFKVGDKVWSPIKGDGEVIDNMVGEDYPIVVRCAGKRLTYTEDGKYYPSHAAPTLFHEKPDCYKTKRVVEVEKWGIVYDDGSMVYPRSEEHADAFLRKIETAKHKIKLTGSYEVWE